MLKINDDVLQEIMIHMNIVELYHFCKVSIKLCDNIHFWKVKNQYDKLKDEKIITLNYIKKLAKDIDLNMSIHIGLPEDIYYKYGNYKELHQILNIKNIPNNATYVIKITPHL